MNDRFLLIKINDEYENIIIDVVKELFGHRIDAEKSNDNLIIYHNYENDNDIINLIKSLESDLDTKILSYVSYKGTCEELKQEINIANTLLSDKKIGNYNLKSLLLESDKIENKKDILNFILKDTGINQEFILEFASSNLNASKAAINLYMHRNTIIYKLDKLMSLRGFDLKSFIDMHILYSLSK